MVIRPLCGQLELASRLYMTYLALSLRCVDKQLLRENGQADSGREGVLTDGFHTKKLCSKLSSSEVLFYTANGRIAFLSPLWGGLRATCDIHLRLIGKRVVNFLLMLIKLCFLGVTAETLRANMDWKSAFSLLRCQLDPKFQVEGVAPTNHS